MKDINQQEYAIEVNNVCKDFKVYYDKGFTLKERLLFWQRNEHEVRHVLKNISFKVKKGEAVGLIGQNGAGKSTTLKLLSKIIYPNSGSIIMRGRVSCLIELGAGFHPDMSGRENIYTNAAIFGLKREEIDKRIDDIIAFSELEEFIDNPVRTYSSGMYMRLAFSVAINVDADILLIDEILAVGDAAFQAKCFNKLREVKASGVTIVIVSHSLGQIEQICDRTIWFKDGNIEKDGIPYDVHPYYLEFMGKKATKKIDIAVKENSSNDNIDVIDNANINNEQEKGLRWGSHEVIIQNIKIMNKNGKESSLFKTGSTLIIEVNYKVTKTIDNLLLGFGIFRNDGLHIYGTNTDIDKYTNFTLNKEGMYYCIISNMNLLPGEYFIDVAISKSMGFDCDYWKKCKKINIYSDVSDVGLVRLQHNWEV